MIVQSDRTILLEVDHPLYAEARDALAQFAELEKSPEHIHTYRLTPLSLWNAAASGLDAARVLALLDQFTKYDLPPNIVTDIREYYRALWAVEAHRETGSIWRLISEDVALITEVSRQKRMQPFIVEQRDANTLIVDPARRGHIKQALVAIGFPAEDLAGYTDGEGSGVRQRETARLW